MEELLADSTNTTATENNNVVDNLELLKQNQLSTMETAQQIDSLVKEQELKADDLLNSNDQIDNTVKFENLINNKESDELIKELTDQPDESNSQFNEQVNNFLIETPKNTEELNDLSESTIQLLQDLNDTTNSNLLDSSKNTTNSEHSSTVEAFLEQPNETVSDRVLIDNLLEDNKPVQDLTSDSIQSQPEATNLNEITQENLLDQLNDSKLTNESISESNLEDQSTQQIDLIDVSNQNEITQESLLDQSNDIQVLNLDDSKLTNESISEINLANQSSTQEISLVNISDENVTNDQIKQKEELSLLDQVSKPEESDKPILLNSLLNDDKENKNDFVEDLSNEMDKKVDEFISNLKSEGEHQKEIEQLEDHAKLTLEDFVTKNEEIKTNESKNDNLLGEETAIIKKLDECKLSSNELKNDCEEIKEENKPEIADEKTNEKLGYQEAVSSKSKSDEILTQSQELLRKADKLIEEKRNSINEINIPGLDLKINPESIIKEQTNEEQDQQEQSAKEPEAPLSTDNKPSQTNESANENAKSQKNTKKCVIS